MYTDCEKLTDVIKRKMCRWEPNQYTIGLVRKAISLSENIYKKSVKTKYLRYSFIHKQTFVNLVR